MSGKASTDPNRFGANSAGLCRLVDEVLQLSDEQWLTVGETSQDVSSLITSDLIARQNRADLSQRSAVDKLLDETFQSLKVRLREVGGRPLSLGARVALWVGAYAVAFPGVISDEEFDVAVAPFVAVGIDCQGLSRLGLVEE